jgi:hypothetical protein
VRLAKSQSYLVLRESANAKGGSSVILVPDLTIAIKAWDYRTRISPLYGLSNVSAKSPTTHSFLGQSSLFFIGPISPFKISTCLAKLSNKCNAWMTVGAFNFVVHVSISEDIRAVKLCLRQSNCRWECWKLSDGDIAPKPAYSSPEGATFTGTDSLALLKPSATIPEFQNAVDEYSALMASALTRSQKVYPLFSDDLESASAIVISRIQKTNDANAGNTLAMLVDINAALSRFSSQTFSGASPIRETECHFWTHSLLGTGVANIALANMGSFLKRTLGEARIPERVKLYQNIQENIPYLPQKPLSDPVWQEAWIDKVDHIVSRSPLFPQITYFSGRDGFKTTETSLSAPLSVIPSCNSQRWSLLTITHEATHTIIGGVLAVLLPRFDDTEDIKLAVDQLNGGECKNLLHEIRRFILRIMVEMEQGPDMHEVPDKLTEDDVIDIVNRWKEEVEEIMVHTFDFLFFYGQIVDIYIEAIWRSWDTIPHLNSKINEYVIRTLCVAASRHLDVPNTFKRAREDMTNALTVVAKELRPSSYVNMALRHLKEDCDDSSDAAKEVEIRKPLVAIVRAFLHSPSLLEDVRGQSDDRYHASSISQLKFTGERIENPLRFIEVASDLDADAAKSLWTLQRLAFDLE